jgi:hypothetical protein
MGFFALAALGLSLGSTVNSVREGQKAAKSQRKANEVSRKIEDRQRQRERMQSLREAQILRAQGTQMAANTGALDSSGYAGQQAGITAATAGNIAFSQQVSTGAQVIGQYTQRAAASQNRAGNWSALAALSLQAASMSSFGAPTAAPKANAPVGPVQ